MEECEWKDHHPEMARELAALEGRVDTLEQYEANRNKIRANDLKEFREEMKSANSQITVIRIQLAGLNGKLLAAAFFVSGFGAVGMFMLTKLFDAGARP